MHIINLIIKYVNLLQYNNESEKQDGALYWIKNNIIPIIVVALFGAMFVSLASVYFEFSFWRHDSFQHCVKSQYEWNLKHEGRWINHYLFNIIKSVSGSIAGVISLISVASFGFLCAKRALGDNYLSAVLGLSFVMLPMLHCQNMWPNITMAAALVLPLMYFISTKIKSPYLIFGIAGILSFGTLSLVYFLIPFLFFGDLQKNLKGDFKSDFTYFMTHLIIPYALGFVLGFLVSTEIVILNTGSGLEMSEVRKASPIDGFDQFMINFDKVNNRLILFLNKFFSTNLIFVWVAATLLIALSWTKKSIWFLLALLAMAVSAFYTTIYHGIIISDRTLLASGIPLIAIFIFMPALKFKRNMLLLIISLLLIYPFYKDTSSQLTNFSKITNYYQKRLMPISDQLNSNYEQVIIVFAENKDVWKMNKTIGTKFNVERKWGESLATQYRTIVTGLNSLGYSQIVYMQDEETVLEAKKQVTQMNNPNDLILIRLPQQPNALGLVLTSGEIDLETLEQL